LLIEFRFTTEFSVRDALRREWLLTNGLGGFAMGSVPGVNTRRYHGLFIAAAAPPVHRVLLLHSVIESLVTADSTIDLSTHLFGERDLLHPDGWRHLAEASVDPPRRMQWMFRTHIATVTKTLSLAPNENEATVAYDVEGNAAPVTLRLLPFTPLRDFHSLDAADSLPPLVDELGGEVRVTRDRLAASLRVEPRCAFHREQHWWEQFAYSRDRERGQPWRDDVCTPGRFEVAIPAGGGSCTLVCRLDRPALERAPVPPRPNSPMLTLRGGIDEDVVSRLRVAADQFVVRRRTKGGGWTTSIIAGYPWFADWGRDSMICVPGLLLAGGRRAEAIEVMRTFASRLRNGLIPNCFDDYQDDSHYNSVDASLWFVHALRQCAQRGGDASLDADLVNAGRSIINAYRRGVAGVVRLDRDGLIIAGSETTQLTWMDAKRGETVFTPRHGKPIEINALWHSALRCFAELTADENERDTMLELAGRCAISMQMQFWWPQMSCCHDVLSPMDDPQSPGGVQYVGDARLRPNQIFAVSVPFSPLTKLQQRDVARVVGQRLLTPQGLRTLDPADPGYRARFEGDMHQRDAAYHNGTVWPWLLGPYCEAILRLEEFSDSAKSRVRALLQPLLEALDARSEGCINQLAEVYDGDEPRRPAGCLAQAWSVAEVLRVLMLIQ
jgi:predicted glycogen debranching enzyme